jgi:lipopolysaccharide transport system ATP-binding protein
MGDDVLIRADGVSKKFCRSLKKSLWYGVRDSVADLAGRGSGSDHLRADEFWAVNDVSFEVRRGECLGLIGGNGAGKTTLLKMLNGLIKPDGGRIEMRGRVGALIALGAGFNPILTGRENIYVNGSVLGLTQKEINAKFDEIVDFAEIQEFIDSPVQGYSSGMSVRLGFAIAVAVEPDVLLLDEVLAVGDVSFQAKCFNTLAEFRKRGTAFILVSHNMHMISRYCQQALYLRHGKVQHLGDVATGIAQLTRDLATTDANKPAAEARPMGSGRIQIKQIRFLDLDDQPVTEIDVGEPVTLALDYVCDDRFVRSTVLDLVIRENLETIYQGERQFDDLPNSGQLRVAFKYLPSNTEHVDFAVALFDRQSAEIFDWQREIRLRVKRNEAHQGRLFLPTEWTVAAPPDSVVRRVALA